MHAGIQILLLDDFARKVDPVGARALISNTHLKFFGIERKDHLDKFGGLALIAMVDRIIDGFTDRQFEIFHPLGRQANRLPSSSALARTMRSKIGSKGYRPAHVP